MGEQTYEYRGPRLSDSIYLTRFGVTGMRAWSEIMTERQTADAMSAKLAASAPTSPEAALAFQFAARGIELARTKATQWATAQAMQAMEAELLPTRPAAVAPAQPDTCRHGVSYAAVCPQCEE